MKNVKRTNTSIKTVPLCKLAAVSGGTSIGSNRPPPIDVPLDPGTGDGGFSGTGNG